MSDFLLGTFSSPSPPPPGYTSESGDADDEAGADDAKPEVNEETTSQDDTRVENVAQDNASVRKRTKVKEVKNYSVRLLSTTANKSLRLR
jgi:hypothetical protein